MNNLEIINRARMQLILRCPFFATLLLGLEMKIDQDSTVDTAATDGVSLWINSSWFCQLPLRQQLFILAHEVMHPAMLHHTRRNGRDPRKWNEAADYAINQLLRKDKALEMPSDALYDPKYEGMGAEDIYTKLAAADGQQDGSGGGSGDDQQDDQQDGSGGGSGDDQQDGDADGQGGGESASGSPQSSCGEVRDYPYPDQVDEHELQQQQRIVTANESSQMSGHASGIGSQLVAQILEGAKVDWRDVLRDIVSEKCSDDYSWRKGNRRYFCHDIYLPSLDSDTIGQVGIFVDVSGSIGQSTLNVFATELNELSDIIRSEKYVSYCDTSIRREDWIDADDEIELEVCGGGGTDFRPPFIRVEDENISLKLAIYLTDGYCYDFPDAPDYPVIWALYDRSGRPNSSFNPPFGDVIIIDNN